MTSRADQLVTRGPVRLYVAIVVLYTVLMGWWVYFFATQGPRLSERVGIGGEPLSEAQAQALHEASRESMRMFLFEGTFLGLLVLGSVWLVIRALRREILLHRQQRNFLSAVTHELRSPLASARLYLESILMGRAEGERGERYLRHAKQDLDRLTGRVEDILLTRRLTENGVSVHADVVDLSELVTHAVVHQTEMHDDRSGAVHVDAPRPVLAHADAQAVEQILDNLLSNAIKYGGDRKDIAVSVREEKGRAVLEVRDHGPGLEGADPKALLRPFERGGEHVARSHPGVGLGLFIVNELVRAHEGRLSLRDDLAGGGTCVRVSLPGAHAVKSSAKVAPAAAPEGV